jgi:hypothetical protein
MPVRAFSRSKSLRTAVPVSGLPRRSMNRGSPQAADQIGVESRHWLARPVAQQVARALVREAREIRGPLGPDPIPELDTATFA